MRQSLLLFFVLAAFSSHAQIGNFQVSIAPNVALIPSVTQTVSAMPVTGTGPISYAAVGSVHESFKAKIGASASFQGDYKFSSRFFITTGLGIDLFRYKRRFDVSSIQFEDGSLAQTHMGNHVYPGVVIGSYYGNMGPSDLTATPLTQSDKTGNTSLLFAQVPVLAGTSFFNERLRVSAGASFKFLLWSSETQSYYDYSTGTVKDRKVHETEHFETFNAAGLVNVSYYITKYFAVSATGTKSFTSLYTADKSMNSTNLNAISLGANFILR